MASIVFFEFPDPSEVKQEKVPLTIETAVYGQEISEDLATVKK